MSDIRFVKFGDTDIFDVLRGNLLLGFFDSLSDFVVSDKADNFSAQELRAIADELDRRNGVKDEAE